MTNWNKEFENIFINPVQTHGNIIILKEDSQFENQSQTNEIFSEKWLKNDNRNGLNNFEGFQRKWYLDLYGFNNEEELSVFLKTKKIILDAGCGLGYKAAWFATLSPESLVIGMDFSDSIFRAAKNYSTIPNLFFVKGDIAETNIRFNSLDYVSCDQVIHHTENPPLTFTHLCNILKPSGEFACYVYAKKALPRELLDDYFRDFSKKCSKEELWKMSRGLTELGKNLSEVNLKFNCPDIPLLGIKGGEYDIQRFLYWNFLKCFWNPEMGYEESVDTNFDWYGPSNAFRYSEQEYKKIITDNNLQIIYFHKEEACYSGRFMKQ